MGVFSDTEIKRRQQCLAHALSSMDCDLAILHTADNVYYTSGVPLLSPWGRPLWSVVSNTGKTALIGSKGEKINNERNGCVTEVHAFGDEDKSIDSAIRITTEIIKRWIPRSNRIALELPLIPYGVYEAFQREFQNCGFCDVTHVLNELRIIKSAEELALLELGGTVAKVGAHAFLEALAVNVSELSVVGHAVTEMNRAIAALSPDSLSSCFAYCHFGDHTLTPHLHATGRRLKHGELVALNVFPVISGYLMELERTLVFGSPTKEQKRALEAVTSAFESGKATLRPGIKASDIDHLTRGILSEQGYQEYLRSGTGHAHGIMIGAAGREELGELRTYNDTIIRAGMVHSIEPAIYVPELGGGFRHSDVMIVTQEGSRCVTAFPTELTPQLSRTS